MSFNFDDGSEHPNQKSAKKFSIIMVIAFMIIGPTFILVPFSFFGNDFDLPSFVYFIIFGFLALWEGILILVLFGIIKGQNNQLGMGGTNRLVRRKSGDLNSLNQPSSGKFDNDNLFSSKNSMFSNSQSSMSRSYISCPYCGKRVEVSADFCSKCGNKL